MCGEGNSMAIMLDPLSSTDRRGENSVYTPYATMGDIFLWPECRYVIDLMLGLLNMLEGKPTYHKPPFPLLLLSFDSLLFCFKLPPKFIIPLLLDSLLCSPGSSKTSTLDGTRQSPITVLGSTTVSTGWYAIEWCDLHVCNDKWDENKIFATERYLFLVRETFLKRYVKST